MNGIHKIFVQIGDCARKITVRYPCLSVFERNTLPAKLIDTFRHTAAAKRIRDQADPSGEKFKRHPDNRRMDMQSVADQFGIHILPLTASPDHSGAPVMDRRHCVEQMRNMRSSGVKSTRRIFIRRIGMGC